MNLLDMGAFGSFLGMIIVLSLYALVVFVFYLVIKKAVKNGILEAHAQTKESDGATDRLL